MRSDAPFLGQGWGFPPTFARGGADVEVVSGLDDVRQSLQIILGTAPGERVLQESFGCALGRLLFEERDQSLINRIEKIVSDALLSHEPRIHVDAIDVTESSEEQGCLLIRVDYTVRGTNSRFNLVFPFYLMEAAQPGLRGL